MALKKLNMRLKKMKTITKIIIGFMLITFLLVPVTTQLVSAKTDKIDVKEGQDAITITTEYITMKIREDKPHFIWWNGNQSTADEIYNVQFNSIQEYFGDDEFLDTRSELVGGIVYNLQSNEYAWDTEILEGDTDYTITLTLSGLANNVEIQFIIQIFESDQLLTGTDQIIDGLTEIKFDIIVKNWVFTEGAQGLGIEALLLESQKKHQVRVRSGSDEENGNKTRTMQYESEEYGKTHVAYYEWTTFADVYDDSTFISRLDVSNTILEESSQGVGPGEPEESGTIHHWLTYPNYGDSLTLVHDPSLGIYPESFTVSLIILPSIGGILAIVFIVSYFRKRK